MTRWKPRRAMDQGPPHPQSNCDIRQKKLGEVAFETDLWFNKEVLFSYIPLLAIIIVSSILWLYRNRKTTKGFKSKNCRMKCRWSGK